MFEIKCFHHFFAFIICSCSLYFVFSCHYLFTFTSYRLSLIATKQAISSFKQGVTPSTLYFYVLKAGIPYLRPTDYFAEMVKPPKQMARVRFVLATFIIDKIR